MSQPIYQAQNIPSTACLVIPNRLNFQSLLVLEKAFSGRNITWLCEESTMDMLDPLVNSHLDRPNVNAVALSHDDENPEESGAEIRETYLTEDNVVIFLPGNTIATNGSLFHVPGKTLDFITALKLPTLPVCITHPQECCLIIENPSSLPKLEVTYGELISAENTSTPAWQSAIFEMNEARFSSRDFLNQSLPYALLKGLKKYSSNHKIIDGSDDKELTYDKVLGIALALAKKITQLTSKPRVGIILPPGKGGLIANLAVVFAGKVPVNLNFTASKSSIESCIKQAGIDKYISADPFIRKMPAFPWPANRDIFFIERELPKMKSEIRKWVITSKMLPVAALAKAAKISTKGGDKEAVLLFTSGSSGNPKGVTLTHRNVLANVCQFGTRIDLPENSSVLGCLPLFHSFGCTVTLWYPCIEGLNLVTYPSPLETKRLAELIEKHQIALLLSTPTFLRGFMRKIEREKLASIKICATGAEKLQESIARKFEEKFGILPQEGYGLTETSPASNINVPDTIREENGTHIPSSRFGSVGQFIQGMAVKITNIDDEISKPINEPGIIWLKGSNVFPGYLNNQEKTDEVIIDGWFTTGDVGRVDSDGFLYIEGRISRFSKIGGEMVPHESLENTVNTVLGLSDETERKVAVLGIPDPQKGEAIVLLSTVTGISVEQECIDLRYRLLDAGIPSLWCPKKIIAVDEIPVLASGKLDIKACEILVQEGI